MFAYLKRVPSTAIQECQADANHAREYITGHQPDTETQPLKQSWDGLHFLLSPNRRKPSSVWDTSTIWHTTDFMGIAIIGKETLNEACKLGFVTPKWVAPGLVAQISFRLRSLSWDSLEEAYSPDKMRQCGVYPDDLWDDEEKGRKFLRYWFQQLVRFYEKASSLDQAVICYLKLQV
jgi:hypothetical protein